MPLSTVIDENFELDLRSYGEKELLTSETLNLYPVDRERMRKIDAALKKMEAIHSERMNKKNLLMDSAKSFGQNSKSLRSMSNPLHIVTQVYPRKP